MRRGCACLAAIIAGSIWAGATALETPDRDPVLRLRLQDPVLERMQTAPLRPRFEARILAQSLSVPDPNIAVQETGRIGTFAYLSTLHPNLVVAVGATDDGSELGRQVDRAIIEMTRGELLFNRQSDSAPFMGVGVRSGSSHPGWSADAAIGFGVLNAPDQCRLSGALTDLQTADYQAEPSAHVAVRYRF